MGRYSKIRILNIDKTEVKCEICDKICKGDRSLKSHKTQMHLGTKDTTNRGRPKGIPAWNKGKISKPDLRDPSLIGRHGGYRPNAGRSKKFKVYDSFGNRVTLQSTYENVVFEILCELGIRWIRPKALKYGERNYFADFYLVDIDLWLDPKNDFKFKQDAEKIRKVIEQNNIRLVVLKKEQLTKDYIAHLAQW